MTSQVPDPVDNPRVPLCGADYELKFRVSDLKRLKDQYQIEIGEKVTLPATDAFDRVCKILQHAIAHANTSITLQQIEDYIELQNIGLYVAAISEAASKVSPQAAAALAKLVPKVEPQPITDAVQ